MTDDRARRVKRWCWAVLDAVCFVLFNAVAALFRGWEALMDRIWRVRCWLVDKPMRPY